MSHSWYKVEFADGLVERYTANQIAENIFEQLDDEGNKYLLVEAIIDHRRSEDAVTEDNAYVMINGRRKERRTTKGWELCV